MQPKPEARPVVHGRQSGLGGPSMFATESHEGHARCTRFHRIGNGRSCRLSTSWMLASPADEFTARMFGAVNARMLDVLAPVARKDYEERRRRQAQGHRRRRRRRPKAATEAATRIQPATLASRRCSRAAPVGPRSQLQLGAAGRRWRRSPSARRRSRQRPHRIGHVARRSDSPGP